MQEIQCEMRFEGVAEKRRSKSFTDPSRNTYDIENFPDYLDEQISAMMYHSEGGPELIVKLRHAYAQGKSMRGFYTVVLSLDLDEDPPVVLRGRHDVTNWMGSSSEFERGLTSAADQVHIPAKLNTDSGAT